MSVDRSIEQLLAFLDDVQPAPKSIDRTASGPGPMRKEPCPTCDGTGRIKRHNNRPCVRCGGDLSRSRPGRGWVWFDEYVEQEVGSEETTTTDYRKVEIACWTCNGMGVHPSGKRCVWCMGTGKRRLLSTDLPEGTREEDATLAALAATRSGEAIGLRRRGSFDALEQGLLLLPPSCRAVVLRIHVLGWPREELSDEYAARLTVSVRALRLFVEARDGRVRVPVEIRRWWADNKGRVARGPHSNVYARGQRNEEIRRLAETPGWSHRRIAEKIGISRSAVSRVLGASPGRVRAAAGQPTTPATVGPREAGGDAL